MLSEQVGAMRTCSHAMQCNENITPTDARHKTQKKKKQMQGIFLEQTRQNSQLTNFASLRFESSCKSIHGYNTCPKLSEEAAQAPHHTTFLNCCQRIQCCLHAGPQTSALLYYDCLCGRATTGETKLQNTYLE